MGSRCRGQCCQAFVLGGYDLEYIQRSYDNTIRMWLGEDFGWTKPEGWLPTLVNGIFRWWPWMVYLGRFKAHPVTGAEHQEMDYFTCSQFSEEGNCLVYDRRPHFCRTYGITTPCEHEGCQWAGAWKKGEPAPVSSPEMRKALMDEVQEVDVEPIDVLGKDEVVQPWQT